MTNQEIPEAAYAVVGGSGTLEQFPGGTAG